MDEFCVASGWCEEAWYYEGATFVIKCPYADSGSPDCQQDSDCYHTESCVTFEAQGEILPYHACVDKSLCGAVVEVDGAEVGVTCPQDHEDSEDDFESECSADSGCPRGSKCVDFYAYGDFIDY